MTRKLGMYLAVALLGATTARADVWDQGTDNDNDSGSDNEIVHGLSQTHDLAARSGGTVEDADWYAFRLPDSRSFEIRIDGMTGDTTGGGGTPTVDLLASDATTVEASAEQLTSFGTARSLRVASPVMGGLGYTTYFLRIANPQCALNCTGDDEYRIHAFDTTLSLPRYNNANGQVTVVVLQNPTRVNVAFLAGVFSGGGALLGSFGAVIAPYATSVINLSTVNGGAFNNTSGSLVIRHNGPYQGLAGKGVAVEPATGFTFDTAITSAPQ